MNPIRTARSNSPNDIRVLLIAVSNARLHLGEEPRCLGDLLRRKMAVVEKEKSVARLSWLRRISRDIGKVKNAG